jgi:tetratricopeptide (TPR) repeat protein
MKKNILFSVALLPFALSAQVDCVDAKDCYLRGTQSIFDNTKIQFQNDCFTKAIAFDPNYVDAYHYRGGNFFRQEKYKEAIADYTKYIELIKLEPKQSKFVLAKIHYYRGESYLKLGNKKEALADYKMAMEVFPKEEKYTEAYNTLKNQK